MESIKQLRQICQPADEHPVYKAWRIFSIYFTSIFLRIGFKNPNHITIFSLLLGIAGGLFYIQEQFIIGTILFILARILDDVDGEIARYHKVSSDFGAWFDTLAGHLLYPYFFLTLGLGVFFGTRGFYFFLLGALGAVLKLIERSVPKAPKSQVPQQQVIPQVISAEDASFKEWLSFTTKFSIIYPLALIFSLLYLPQWFLLLSVPYLAIFTLLKIVQRGKRIYEVSQ